MLLLAAMLQIPTLAPPESIALRTVSVPVLDLRHAGADASLELHMPDVADLYLAYDVGVVDGWLFWGADRRDRAFSRWLDTRPARSMAAR